MSRKSESGTAGIAASGMSGIDLRIMKRLLKFMQDAQLTELDIEMEGVKVRLRKGISGESAPAPMPAYTHVMPVPVATAAASAAPAPASPVPVAPVAAPAAPPVPAGPVIKSPMVGTFYRAPSPTSPPFVNVGDIVKEGQTLCLIEAMKLMNEIKAERAGKIAKILGENGQPVEFDQVLFEYEAA